MKRVILAVLSFAVVALLAYGTWLYMNQQSANRDYAPKIAAPNGDGDRPVIAIDASHSNYHLLDGRFEPFGKLAKHGGYQVDSLDAPITSDELTMDVLVIANANETLDAREIDSLVGWIENGGSLLLIADHAPFGAYARSLAQRIGVTMGNGFVLVGPRDEIAGTIDFTGSALGDHPIIAGSGETRRVDSVRSFTGQSLTAPEGASVLLTLPDGAAEYADREAARAYIDGGPMGADVGGKAQALALEYGAGRVVISGEAAMFTSQTRPSDTGRVTFGVDEVDNEAYVLNILDWLSRRLD